MKSVKLLCAAAIALGASTSFAQSQTAADYPVRPITVVMPTAPGSAGDVLVRIVTNKMAADLGRTFVAENVTGAAGALGVNRAQRAAPDGYTLLGTGDNQLIYAPLFNRSAKFDARTDFEPITQVATLDWALVANPNFPAKTVQDLVRLAKEKPGEINFASGGVGTAQQIAMELLMARTGIKLTHVPYRGVTPGLNDVVAGVVPLMFTAVSVATPFLPNGHLRVIATTGRKRSSLLPDVPTMQEAGIEGFEFDTWVGLLAPKGTPAPIVARLHDVTAAALKDPTVRERLAAGGFTPVGSTPAEFAATLASDWQRIGDIIQTAGITPN
jgi:tripartite-type tricarboxylate transporter receptor subunit TctC